MSQGDGRGRRGLAAAPAGGAQTMTRIAAMIAGVLLIVCPALWLIEVAVPVPQYRKGGYADFLFLGRVLLAIYGSVLLGVAVYWVRANRSGQPSFPMEVFKAGMLGVLV